MAKVVVAAIVAVLLVGVSAAVLSRRPAGFDVTATTDAPRYEGGEATMTARVCSNAWWLSRMSAGHVTWEVVDRKGTPVANDNHEIRTADIRTEWWRPGQCRAFAVAWDLRVWNQAPAGDRLGEPVRGAPAPDGDYRFVATWHAARFSEPPRPAGRASSPWFAMSRGGGG